jgi:hypothetical protein
MLYDFAAMICPGCASEMQHLALDGKLGTKLAVDVCVPCGVVWFDHLKELQLAPQGTLSLFGMIAAPPAAQESPLPAALRCPRCGARLALTHDIQRTTRFQYFQCPAGHGRLITFADFLREKDFVRPLTPAQLDELRQSVRTVNCGNCGAPIDLMKDSVCAHCGSAVSILDPAQMARTIAQLQNAAAGRSTESAATPDHGLHAPDFDALMQAMKTGPEPDSPHGLIDAGLRLLGELLKNR